MPSYTPIVNNPGDFKWKPLSSVKSSIGLPIIKSTNGMGFTRSVKIGTVPLLRYILSFESSKQTYDEVYYFLLLKGFGHEEFTWRNPDDNILYTVRQEGALEPSAQSDNTGDQLKLSYQYDVTLVISTDVQGL